MRRAVLCAAFAVSAGLLGGSLSACSSGGAPSATAGVISVSNGGCGGSWHLAGPGWHTFHVHNAAAEGGTIDLVNPGTNGIYAEIETIGPGTTVPMRLDVGSGSYAFRCLFEDYDPITGPIVTVSGHAQGTKAIVPVTSNDLIAPAKQYHTYVTAGLNTLVSQVDAVNTAVREGNLATAKTDWLSAHLTYERLGAAYDSFGDFDDEIDGRPDGLVGGVNSPKWTGFYRLEYGLWHGQSAHELTGVAATLDHDVRALRASWPTTEINLLDIGLRTHEILENALEFQLTGHDDYGSGSTLATTQANITGTRELLTILHSLLVPRYPGLPGVYTALDQLQNLLTKEQKPDGTWVAVGQLPLTTRQDINASCSGALEELAPIAAMTEPRIT